jgi:hypothetical protein
VRAFGHSCSGPGGVSRQSRSHDGIRPGTDYVSTRDAECRKLARNASSGRVRLRGVG